MLSVVKNSSVSWVIALFFALAFTSSIHAQQSASPEFIQAEIGQLTEEIIQLEARADSLEARAANLEARADRTRNQRRATRLRNRADALNNRATNISVEILALQNQIAELESQLAQGPDPEPVPAPAPQPQPGDIEGISVADLFLSPAAQAILDANPNAESSINDRMVFTATNAQASNTVLGSGNVDLSWRNNGDGNMVRLRPNSAQQFFFEQVRSADQDFNAVRDEFLPIVRTAVNALVDNVNAASPGLPPLTPTTR